MSSLRGSLTPLETRLTSLEDFWYVSFQDPHVGGSGNETRDLFFPSQTNDSGIVGTVRMEDFVIVVSSGIKSTNSSGQLQKWMERHFHDHLAVVEVKGEGIGVAEFIPGTLSEAMKSVGSEELTFDGEPLHLFPAYLIWIPFHVPVGAHVSPSIIIVV